MKNESRAIRFRLIQLFNPLMLAFLFYAGFSAARAQQAPSASTLPYLNPDLSVDQRVADLVGRMTLEEKVKQMLYDAPAIEWLRIPPYNWWNEGLHGVARAGRATVFPQAIGLAATWDTGLIRRIATVISDEARAKYNDALHKGRHGIYEGLTFWSPNINLFRDPRWGRGMETYGEDPYLSGRLAVEFVRGMQGEDKKYLKTIATPKHFAVHSGPEPARHTFDAVVDERDLLDTYLPQFRAAVIDGKAQSVMCAYNRFRGMPCCGSDELLQRILRDEWGFDGYVVSDCWAIMDFYATHKVVQNAPEAAAMALKAGTDLNCGVTYDSLAVAVKEGLVSEQLVDQSVKRLFRARFNLGMFDPPDRVPYTALGMDLVDSKEHRALALEAARKSMVLLKNEEKSLPLSRDIRSIAVIGPDADDGEVLLGNYNGLPSHAVTPLEGIREKVGDRVNVLYERGCDLADSVSSFEVVPPDVFFHRDTDGVKPGLLGEYFDNNHLSGEAAGTRVDTVVDFNWWDRPALPTSDVDTFSVRWTGFLRPPVTGKYSLGVSALGGGRIVLDDSILIQFGDRHVVSTVWKNMTFEVGKTHRIRLEYWHLRPDAIIRLVWSKPEADLKSRAIAAAKRADVTVMCLGLSPRLEGEEMEINVPGFSGGDRVDIGLPKQQEDLLETVAGLGKPVVLVLLNGSALSIRWAASHIPAILEAWYPGEEAGTAVADVLFGDYNPSGRLPVTVYRSVEQLPLFTDYRIAGRTYRYFEGEPLYPFGYGLSYTTFGYSNLQFPNEVKVGDSISVSVDVANTGRKNGEEVVELYLKHLDAPVEVPLRSLEGFRRIPLAAGERKSVSFILTPRQMSIIDEQGKRVLQPGRFEVYAGGSQPGYGYNKNIKEGGVLTGQFLVTGAPILLGEKP